MHRQALGRVEAGYNKLAHRMEGADVNDALWIAGFRNPRQADRSKHQRQGAGAYGESGKSAQQARVKGNFSELLRRTKAVARIAADIALEQTRKP